MDPNVKGLIVAGVALVLLLSGMPIAFGLGAVSVLFIILWMDPYQFEVIAHIIYEGLNDFSLLAIPLFIMMGSTIAATRAGSDLYEALHRWLYRLPGGLVISNIVSCSIFAALCGSSPATAAAIGTMGIPEMRNRGFPDSLATGAIVAGGTLGILIPPSVTMIVYGIATETSIGKLFIAGVLPGALITLLFCIWVVSYVQFIKFRLRGGDDLADAGHLLLMEEQYSWSEKLWYLPRVLPFLMLIFLIMGSLYGGWATPSEAAAVGSISAIFIVIVTYRIISFRTLLKILHMTIHESTMILMIIATSFLFGSVLTNLYITQAITQAIIASGLSKWIMMVLINLFLLVLGCFMPPVAIILIVAPIILPIITVYGFDPIWFGVVMTINMEVGLITPPVGLNLYIVQGIAPSVPLSRVLLGSLPFVIILLLGIVIISIWPEIALWLPNKMITR